MTGRVIVFAKPPGPVSKTRLARALGQPAATALARAFLADSVAQAGRVRGARVVLATTHPEADHGVTGVSVVDQGPGDLGARLERVLARALQQADWAIAIGADTPGLPPAILEAAAHAGASGRAALGHARDGGFTTLALPRCPPGLLADLPWSEATTGAATWDRLVQAGLSPERLEPWFDLDEATDLDRFREAVPRDRAPATWAALDRLFGG